MHELSLARNIIESVTELAKKEKANKVKSISLELGPLSGVIRETMEFCWPEAVRGTFLEGCTLQIDELFLEIMCSNCKHRAVLEEINLICPSCGSEEIEVLKGTEFMLKQMEIE